MNNRVRWDKVHLITDSNLSTFTQFQRRVVVFPVLFQLNSSEFYLFSATPFVSIVIFPLRISFAMCF